MNTQYDLIVIGGGAAGLVASKLARGLGKRVAIIEQAKLGGECTWSGCVPSKALINIASTLAARKKANDFFTQTHKETIDTAKIMNAVRAKSNEIYQTHTPEIIQKAGIDILFGTPRFLDQKNIELHGKNFSASKFIIATGSRPFIPEIPGLNTVSYLTNQTIFELAELPQSMIILGAGPIGVELACALNSLGVHIILVQAAQNILTKEDPELSTILADKMRTDGIDLRLGITVTQVKNENGITCIGTYEHNKTMQVTAQMLLIATGRQANIDHLNLDGIGVARTNRGITVNNTLETTIPNIYACGDVVGPYQFSHMAEYQAVIATRNACIPFFKKKLTYKDKIWVTFSDPEFAVLGLTESQARKEYGNIIEVYRMPYSSLDRAKIDNATTGLCKIITDKKGYILGAHILGARAGELIHEIQLGKHYNNRIWDFYSPIHAYPTYSELIWHLAKKAYVKTLQENWVLRVLKKLFGKTH